MRNALRYLPSVLSKRRPIHLTFFVTARCNARCPFCFRAEVRDAAAHGGPPELSLDEIRRVSASLDGLLWLLFSGGEPFLREDLVEASGVFHDANRVAFLTYPTNGLLPDVVAERTEEVLRRCPSSVVVVKLSLDGIGAAHDALRGTPGGFDRLMRTHDRLAALARRHRRLEVGVNTLFCSANQGRMEEIIDFVRDLEGVRSHTLTMVRGPLRDPTWQRVSLDEYRRAARRLEERWRRGPRRFHRFAGGRLKAAQDRVQRRLVERTAAEGRRILPCYAGRLGLVLTERGELHPCEGRWDASFGNVRDSGYDVRAMLRSETGARVLRDVGASGCHCTHECNLLTNILFNPRMLPRLAWECVPRGGAAGAEQGSTGAAVGGCA